MVGLEELVAVEGHDREPVTPPDAESVAEAMGQPCHPVDVLREGRAVLAVDERHAFGEALRGRQEQAVVDELLHGSPLGLTRADPGALSGHLAAVWRRAAPRRAASGHGAVRHVGPERF